MNPSESPEDQVLRECLAHRSLPPLPDDGFKQRVLASLPLARPERDWRVIAVLAAGVAIGLLWALHNHASLDRLWELGGHVSASVSDDTWFVLALAAGLWVLTDLDGEVSPNYNAL